MWAKMCKRVQGVGSAVRYANDALYGASIKEPPNGLSWREYMMISMTSYKQSEYEEVLKNINAAIVAHYRKSLLTITDSDPDPISGASWRYFCKCVLKGDFKGRWLQNSTNECFRSSYRKHDKTNTQLLNQLIEQHGTAKFKSSWRKKTASSANLLDSPQPN
jgi:predicted phosphoadenosine phosphosulfate sulfurtransferase